MAFKKGFLLKFFLPFSNFAIISLGKIEFVVLFKLHSSFYVRVLVSLAHGAML